jgi:hypothetical protein
MLLARFEGLRPYIRDTTNCLQTEISHVFDIPVARELRSCNLVLIFNFFNICDRHVPRMQ